MSGLDPSVNPVAEERIVPSARERAAPGARASASASARPVLIAGGRPDEEPNRWRLAARLCRRYAGARLEDLYETSVTQTPYGPCLHLVQCLGPFELPLPSPAEIEEAVLSELRLVYGVGPVTAGALRAGGVRRITDLVGHRRFGSSAGWLSECWDRRDFGELHDHIRHRLAGEGHDLGLALAGLLPAGSLVVADLETLGLWGSPMIVFGYARLVGGVLELHQLVVRAGREEPAALYLALEALRGCEAMVTYNGRSADGPWLRQRCAYFGLGRMPERLHLDLLHPIRRRYRPLIVARGAALANDFAAGGLADCRLSTVEAFVLGAERDLDDLPGDAVPHFYREYERRQNIGPLVPIIDHNRADLVAVARLLCLLSADQALPIDAGLGQEALEQPHRQRADGASG